MIKNLTLKSCAISGVRY